MRPQTQGTSMLGTSGTCLKPLSCESSSLFLPNHKDLIYFRFLIPELVEYCVEQITFHLQRFKVQKRHKHRKRENQASWNCWRVGDTSSNEAWDAEDLPKHVDRARRLGFEEVGWFFSPLLIPHWIGTFTYFMRRWGLACSHHWNFCRCEQKEWKRSS